MSCSASWSRVTPALHILCPEQNKNTSQKRNLDRRVKRKNHIDSHQKFQPNLLLWSALEDKSECADTVEVVRLVIFCTTW